MIQRRRFLILLMALVLLLLSVPTQVLAEAYEGYCKDGVPVVLHWPDKYKDFTPGCLGDTLTANPPPDNTGSIVPFTPEQPDDFGLWATIFLNGGQVINPYKDAFPFVARSTGRTLVPIRMVTEAMGGTADWEEASRKVTVRLGEKYITMTIGSAAAVANGVEVTLDQPAFIWKDRTMVPLRVVVEAFGATVGWDEDTAIVDITLAGVTCIPKFCPRF